MSKASFFAICRAGLLLATVVVAGCSSPDEKAQRYYERGMEYLSKQDYAKASIEFRNALQIKKNLIGAWRGLLQVEETNKNIDGTAPILQTIVELEPKDIEFEIETGASSAAQQCARSGS